MTPQEQQMLQDLADRINRTQLPDKDPEAEQFIQRTLGQNPDAEYIMAQTILVQQYALDQAQKQIADLRAQLDHARQQQPEQKHSFLGSLLGHKDEPQRPAAPPPPPPPSPVAPRAADPVSGAGPGLAYPTGGYPIPGAPMPTSGGGGFLRGALQTATGVAAGALAFEGVESLLHGFGHAGGYPGGFGGTEYAVDRPEIVNNYYGDSAPHEHAVTNDGSSFADQPKDNSSSSGDAARFADSSHDAGQSTRDVSDTDTSAGVRDDDVDYSGDADDSMLADDVGDGDGGDFSDSDDSDSGGDFSSGDDSGF